MVALSRSSELTRFFPSPKPTRRLFQHDDGARILFATDLSESSRAGLSWATSLAELRGAQLLIVHVDAPPDATEDLIYRDLDQERANAKAALKALLPVDPSLRASYRVLTGDPATEIVRLAEQENVSLIVLGTHQRQGVQRLLKGSVAESVLRRASCPVFVFRQTP